MTEGAAGADRIGDVQHSGGGYPGRGNRCAGGARAPELATSTDESNIEKAKTTMAAEANMHEVVQRLRSENSEALMELFEFWRALEEFLKTLNHLAAASSELHAATYDIADSRDDQGPTKEKTRELASRLSALVAQFLGAFQQMHGAVQGWDISDTRNRSDPPSSNEPLAPRD